MDPPSPLQAAHNSSNACSSEASSMSVPGIRAAAFYPRQTHEFQLHESTQGVASCEDPASPLSPSFLSCLHNVVPACSTEHNGNSGRVQQASCKSLPAQTLPSQAAHSSSNTSSTPAGCLQYDMTEHNTAESELQQSADQHVHEHAWRNQASVHSGGHTCHRLLHIPKTRHSTIFASWNFDLSQPPAVKHAHVHNYHLPG